MKIKFWLTLTVIASLALLGERTVSAQAPDATAPTTALTNPAPAGIDSNSISEPAPPVQPKSKPKKKSKPAKAKTVKSDATKNEKHVAINPPENAVVTRDAVNVRGLPSFKGETITKLKKGESVTLLEEITLSKPHTNEPAKWYRISMPTNTPVWVHAEFIDATNKTVVPKKLNVRSGAGENYSTVALLKKGEAVKEIRTVENWMEIEAPAGTYAFVAANLLDRQPPVEPVAPPIATAPEIAPPAEPAKAAEVLIAATPEPAPAPAAVVAETPAPVVVAPPPLVKRIVKREGRVWKTVSIQAPTYFQLEHAESGKVINYLHAADPKIFKQYYDKPVIVTGEESLDRRWPTIPVIEVESIQPN